MFLLQPLYESAAISPSKPSTAAYKHHHILPSSDFSEEMYAQLMTTAE